MKNIVTKFQLLQERSAGHAVQNQVLEILKGMTEEAMKMKKEVEAKLRKTEGEGLPRGFGAVTGTRF